MGFLTRWRRRRILRAAFPATWEPHLQGLPFFHQLTEPEQQKLRCMVQVFIAEKNWEGCGGLRLDNCIKVGIAAQACLLILNLDHDWYRKIPSILVYPSAFRSNLAETGPAGVVGPHTGARAGEAWLVGPIILAWDSAFAGGRDPNDGQNTVFHEFAHKLDMLDGYADGLPPLGTAEQQRLWSTTLGRQFEQLRLKVAQGHHSFLDGYGATNPAEFFAVASETFFERGAQMRQTIPDLYQCLQQFYRQDPASRA
jgi:MtfA peptidase